MLTTFNAAGYVVIGLCSIVSLIIMLHCMKVTLVTDDDNDDDSNDDGKLL